jgi:hypothetical protein
MQPISDDIVASTGRQEETLQTVFSIVDLRPGHENNKLDPSPSISSDGTVGTETFSAFSMISASVAA